MGLLELFRQQFIHLGSESMIQLDYITIQNITELYAEIKESAVLVKKQLTMEDVHALLPLRENCDVFTMQPDNLEAFDAIKELSGTAPVHILSSIGLCFLHSGDVLYVFDSFADGQQKPMTPNALRLSPVHRSDIEVLLSVDERVLEVLKKTLPEDASSNAESQGEDQNQREDQTASYQTDPKQSEKDMVRKRICEAFSSRYVEVRVEFSGTSPENVTIPLSRFYEKHNIEGGRLRGSWNLFVKSDLNQILDAGIVNKAKEAELKNLSVSIPTYGRIIRSKDLDVLRARMERIEQDYKLYLRGDKNCDKVGEIKVQQGFSPADAVSSSFDGLAEYLHKMKRYEDYKYHEAVEEFIWKQKSEQMCFSDRVKLHFTSSTYTESQWEDKAFLERFCKAVFENEDFFDMEIKDLIERYMKIMNRVQNTGTSS